MKCLLTDALQVGVPARLTVSLRLNLDLIGVAIDTTADNDHVTAALDNDLLRGAILLAERIALDVQTNAWGHDDKVFVVVLVHLVLSNETKDKVFVAARHRDRLSGVRALGQCALGRHLGKKEQTAAKRETHFAETVDDALAGNRVRVGDVRPRSNLVDTFAVLVFDRVANISKLAVLKDQKVVTLRQLAQLVDQFLIKIVHDVDMRLQDRYNEWEQR